MDMNETVVIPVIMSVVELAKWLGIPCKYAAVIAVIVGALIGVFFVEPHCMKTGLIKGIVYGLTASGIYSGTKNTVQQVKQKKCKQTK